MSSSTSLEKPIPDNFEKIIYDLTNDLSITFPEYKEHWLKWTAESFDTYTPEKKIEELKTLYLYCVSFYPERFFDILYNNDTIFEKDSTKSTCFLPDVDFKLLFNCENVSSKTRKIMWNYLQLILMTIIGSIDSKEGFGNSTKHMFQGINEEELFQKLNDTMESMSNFFQTMDTDETAEDASETANESTEGKDKSTGEEGDIVDSDDDAEEEEDSFDPSNPSSFFEKMKGMPNIKDIYGHLKTLFDGKIGSLAKELTEEISKDMENIFNADLKNGENPSVSTQDVIQNLLKNPEKMTNLIKTVNDKLNKKISDGEITQDELLSEASEIMNKMKDMGDSKQFKEMFKSISKMSGLGSNAKFDMNAFDQKTKQNSTREKLKSKMLKKRTAQLESMMAAAAQASSVMSSTTDILSSLGDQLNTMSFDNGSTEPAYSISEESHNNYKFSIGNGLSENEVTPINPPASTNPKKKKKKKKN